MPSTILIVGNCGSGKTWCMAKLIKKLELKTKAKIAKIVFQTDGELAVLGNYDGSVFQGSDKLSMSVATDFAILRKMQISKSMKIVCEGDRFMNSRFINTFDPFVIKITEDGKDGRLKRNSSQSARQIKAIETRVSKIKSHETVINSLEAYDSVMRLLQHKKKKQ